MFKVCTKCRTELSIGHFYKRKDRPGYRSICKTCFIATDKTRKRLDNTEKAKKFILNNPNYYSNYNKQRKQKDLNFKIKLAIRNRITSAIKNGQKRGSAVTDLGCSIDFLVQYLESKFQPGMGWENWGRTGWHIDHIIPLCRFDLANPEEFKKACHYTNLQPLWAKENFLKRDKILSEVHVS